MNAPILKRVVPAQEMLIYPDGWSTAVGDTYETRLYAQAAELMIATSRRSGDEETEKRVAALLKREIASGFYDRNKQSGLEALTMYVDELKDVPPASEPRERSSWGKPLNILVLRNPGATPDYSLAAGLYGTDGGHVHANGLAIELYGAGMILAPDLGRGTSYWQKDHSEYYSQPPAHNTVIVNGRSNYPAHGKGHIPMKVELVQPAPGQDGDSPNLNIAQASFAYPKPASKQLRTLALVRTGARSGFYVDIFRSDNTEPAEGYHDYLYHGLGQSLSLTDAAGKALALSPSTLLTSAQGNLKGYDYFKNEKSIEHAGDFRGVLALDPGENKPKRAMSLWMLGNKERTIFSVEAPSCRATRDSLPKFMEVPMPALVVRQKGNAWEQPFITVFEPYFEGDGATIESVRPAKIEGDAAGLAAVVIEGRATGEGAPRFRAMVMEDQRPDQPRKVEGYDFQGKAGVILVRGDTVERLFETTVQPSTASAAAKK
ncbi:MAG: heparinase II/III family protein [Verrucomicrobia bacterium]|nr:heparinase II/III family protein [Verrucomicrobiota bacterium]